MSELKCECGRVFDEGLTYTPKVYDAHRTTCMYARIKLLELQNQELRLAIQRAHGQFVEFFKGAMPDAASLPHLMAAHKALRQSSAVADGGEGPFCGCGWYANHPGECNHGVKPKEEINVDGIVDDNGIEFLGKATKQPDGTWQCLANVGGALCRVQVNVTKKPNPDGSTTFQGPDGSGKQGEDGGLLKRISEPVAPEVGVIPHCLVCGGANRHKYDHHVDCAMFGI